MSNSASQTTTNEIIFTEIIIPGSESADGDGDKLKLYDIFIDRAYNLFQVYQWDPAFPDGLIMAFPYEVMAKKADLSVVPSYFRFEDIYVLGATLYTLLDQRLRWLRYCEENPLPVAI